MAATTKPAIHRTREVVLEGEDIDKKRRSRRLEQGLSGGRLDRGAMSVIPILYSTKRIRMGIGAAKLLADNPETDLTCYIDDVIEGRVTTVVVE